MGNHNYWKAAIKIFEPELACWWSPACLLIDFEVHWTLLLSSFLSRWRVWFVSIHFPTILSCTGIRWICRQFAWSRQVSFRRNNASTKVLPAGRTRLNFTDIREFGWKIQYISLPNSGTGELGLPLHVDEGFCCHQQGLKFRQGQAVAGSCLQFVDKELCWKMCCLWMLNPK